MASITLYPGRLKGNVQAPPSKSIAHRAMICAALAGGGKVAPLIDSQDMGATQDCLKALASPHGLPVYPCRESGSTLRFMIPLALVKTGGGAFTGQGRLGQRPLNVYEQALTYARFTYAPGDRLNLTVEGELRSGEFNLPGNVSSQFVTGLLLALPLLKGDSVITVVPPVESAAYIDLTMSVMAAFNVKVERPKAHEFIIPGGQSYRPVDYTVEGDESQAAVFLCANALGHQVALEGLNPHTKQGDARIRHYLQRMGGPHLQGITVDGSQCPDIMPMLALCCALSQGESRIENAGRLRLKECDRLAATAQALGALGADIRAEGDSLIIKGKPSLQGGITVSCFGDHRMAMMLSIAALSCRQPVTLEGYEAVQKSWPGYFDLWQSLGGKSL